PAADSAARRAAHVRTARIRPARAAARAASLATGSHVFHRVHDRRSCGGLEVARTAAPILIETPFAPAQLRQSRSFRTSVAARRTPGECKDLTQGDQCRAKIAI